MIIIPAVKTKDKSGVENLTPESELPADALSIVCDGKNYVCTMPDDPEHTQEQ